MVEEPKTTVDLKTQGEGEQEQRPEERGSGSGKSSWHPLDAEFVYNGNGPPPVSGNARKKEWRKPKGVKSVPRKPNGDRMD